MSAHLYIGIDPDVDKSGFAVWNKPAQKFESIEALGLAEIMSFFQVMKISIEIVVIEAGYMNKGNRHTFKGQTVAAAAKTGENVGRNHQRGMDIVEILEWMKIPYRLQKPITPNKWKDDAAYFKTITGWHGKTNPEKRDAAMLVYGM
jgi:hypothetical protein